MLLDIAQLTSAQ